MITPIIQELDIPTLEKLLIVRIGKPRFDLWFGKRVSFVLNDDKLFVFVPNNHFLEWLNNKFRKNIEDAVKDCLLGPKQIVFQISQQTLSQPTLKDAEDSIGNSIPLGAPELNVVKSDGIVQLMNVPGTKEAKKRDWLDFKSFVVGESNKLAFEMARSLSIEKRGDTSPLVIFGPQGCGKTHLLESSFRSFKNSFPLLPAEFISAEEFTSQFVVAMHKNRMPAFRAKIRSNSLFVFDDVHLLADKPATQKELMLNLDVITQKGGSIIAGMDCHPRMAKKIMPELLDRLMSGMICSVGVPEDSLRIALIKRYWSMLSNQELSLEVTEYLSKEVRGNVRIILGVLKQLSNSARINRVLPTLELARSIVGGFIRCVFKSISLQDIDEVVSTFLLLAPGALKSGVREEKMSFPRNLAMYLARKNSSFTYREIGSYFGNRNHSTVIAGEKKIESLIKFDSRVQFANLEYDLNFLLQSIQQKLQSTRS
jgi:chromosomal replication initiator protein